MTPGQRKWLGALLEGDVLAAELGGHQPSMALAKLVDLGYARFYKGKKLWRITPLGKRAIEK